MQRSVRATTVATRWRRNLFDVDDYGQAMLIVEGDVPTELHDKARLAASNCPEYAITITENG